MAFKWASFFADETLSITFSPWNWKKNNCILIVPIGLANFHRMPFWVPCDALSLSFILYWDFVMTQGKLTTKTLTRLLCVVYFDSGSWQKWSARVPSNLTLLERVHFNGPPLLCSIRLGLLVSTTGLARVSIKSRDFNPLCLPPNMSSSNTITTVESCKKTS